MSDDTWDFVVFSLTLMRADTPQRDHDLRAVFNALSRLVRNGALWRCLPHDFPPYAAAY
jgi:transposase